MLVFNLKEGEKAFIANEVVAHIKRIGRENVKVGFDAPFHVKIHRQKVHEDIARQNPAEVQSQIPTPEMLGALVRLEDLAKTVGMKADELLSEMIRRFGDRH